MGYSKVLIFIFILLENIIPYYKAAGDTDLLYLVKLLRYKYWGANFLRPTVEANLNPIFLRCSCLLF